MSEPSTPVRRRSAKGQQRRQLIIAAAGEVLLDHGFAAVSHRSVAERAELPLSATTYYFSSLDDLIGEALGQLAQSWTAQARAALDGLPARLPGTRPAAEAILSIVAPHPAAEAAASSASILVFYERYLEAARHPHLRGAIEALNVQLDDMIAQILRRADLRHDPECARLVLATTDGALLRAMAEGRDPSAVYPALHRVLELVAEL